MTLISSNLRKAAVLIRSVDADTAAALLAQLSRAEATSLREAIRSLGPIDPDERADILAEFRRATPRASDPAPGGVELSISSFAEASEDSFQRGSLPANANGKRFEFLEHAPDSRLATFLAREHAQTIAVVLSHLDPPRAAAVLGALPDKLQADTIERLSNLGEADADVVAVLENELAAWLKNRVGDAGNRQRRSETVKSILAAADVKTRDGIVANLKTHNAALANQFAPREPARSQSEPSPRPREYATTVSSGESERQQPQRPIRISPQPPDPSSQLHFDQLAELDGRTLARLLGAADPNVLALALAGSSDELVERICEQMPKRMAKEFRRELRRLGPTRLSDVEAAQRAVAELASQQLSERRVRFAGVLS